MAKTIGEIESAWASLPKETVVKLRVFQTTVDGGHGNNLFEDIEVDAIDGRDTVSIKGYLPTYFRIT